MCPNADAGLTCCQAEDLANRDSALYERIDRIFSLQQPQRVLNMKTLGATMGDKTRPPGNGGYSLRLSTMSRVPTTFAATSARCTAFW